MRRVPDTARIAEALSMPGIDPRTWVVIAIVSAIVVDKHGVHLDITTLDGTEEHATIAPSYAGPGFGFHGPLKVGHCVIVILPQGVWDAGARVVGHVWDQGDPPPQEVVDHPNDVVLVVESGQSFRLVVTGAGEIQIGNAELTIQTDAALRGTDYVNNVASPAIVAASTLSGVVKTATTEFGVTPTLPTILTSYATLLGGLQAFADAIAALNPAALAALSKRVMVE